MAETTLSPEEKALRRRARRRLIGAIALALLAVVILPMVFDPEPRPMANNVDIRIPAQSTPFPTAADGQSVPAPALSAPSAPDPSELNPPEVKAPGKPQAPAEATLPQKVSAATKPEQKTEPSKSSTPSDKSAGYYLQLGSFSSKANAKNMVAKAHAAGFKSSILPVSGQYKVRVGPIADKTKTLDYQGQLKAKGLNSVIVEP